MLTERLVWENKARLFYRMRHDGLPRLNKPFPTASDAHYPAIDMAIRKLKPFFIGQVLAGNKVCSFTSLKPQLDALSQSAADYYDFLTLQRTNFLRELNRCVDFMLLYGRGVMKSTVDPLNKYAIVDQAVNPFFILMPQEADDFEDADQFVHVRPFTVPSYQRLDDRYDKDPSTIAKIRGSKDFQSIGLYNQDVRLREGIALTRQPNQILLWEHYVKTAGGWTVYTYCPMAPDLQLRKPYGVPYKVDNKASLPFFSFPTEIKEEGWYAPRGIAELIAPVEQYLTKLWNEKADAMTFANRPLYTGEKEITNTANFRWAPGEYIPGNIRGVQQTQPPFSFDEELGFAQSIAEQQTQSPDFGIVSPGEPGQTGGKPRTATENQRISALAQSGVSYNGQLFRDPLAKLHRHRWGMVCQFKERDFAFYAAGEISTLPAEALHDQYLITPDGSPEGWNPMARFQKAMGGLQAFSGNPNVDPEVLTQEALMAYDGRIALKAFVPTNIKGASEYEDEAVEINSLLAPGSGKPAFPAQAKPNEDHPSRIKAILDWLHAAGALRTPVDPVAMQRVHQHLAQHLQFLKQQNPKAAQQLIQQIAMMEKAGQPIMGPNGAPGNWFRKPQPSPPTQQTQTTTL